jgi:carboxymethylenebutenolidase
MSRSNRLESSGEKMGEMIEIHSAEGGRFAAYLARPAASRAPGLVLLQYICGVNRVMRGLADGFAAEGYLVAVPDLFWRQEPGVRLIDDPAQPSEAETKKSLALNAGFDDEAGVADLAATLAWLRASPASSGKVGALGYCLGGRLAFLMATRTDADCCVGYYGVNIERYLGEAARIRRPLLLHIAERDALCPPPAQAQIIAALARVPGAATEVHPGAGHAFALPRGHNFSAAAAEAANLRSAAFLSEHLRS